VRLVEVAGAHQSLLVRHPALHTRQRGGAAQAHQAQEHYLAALAHVAYMNDRLPAQREAAETTEQPTTVQT
jgi:hypothetical protein